MVQTALVYVQQSSSEEINVLEDNVHKFRLVQFELMKTTVMYDRFDMFQNIS
jgi:hypothetical protein